MPKLIQRVNSWIWLLLALFCANTALAERDLNSIVVERLSEQSSAHLLFPNQYSSLEKIITKELHDSYAEYDALLGPLPAHAVTLHLMHENDFSRQTGAPGWTNALFYRGEILIPIGAFPLPADRQQELRYAVKHEYMHSVVRTLSGGRAPGWLDEGLAQLVEGSDLSALHQALRLWLERNPPVSLALLQGGFTRLPEDMVPAAYAQSLVFTASLVQHYGFAKIRDLLLEFREDGDKNRAFLRALSVNERSLEESLNDMLGRWVKQKPSTAPPRATYAQLPDYRARAN